MMFFYSFPEGENQPNALVTAYSSQAATQILLFPTCSCLRLWEQTPFASSACKPQHALTVWSGSLAAPRKPPRKNTSQRTLLWPEQDLKQDTSLHMGEKAMPRTKTSHWLFFQGPSAPQQLHDGHVLTWDHGTPPTQSLRDVCPTSAEILNY